jgi:hypothetical protein
MNSIGACSRPGTMSSSAVSGGLSAQPTVVARDPSVSENVPPFQRSGFHRRQRTPSASRSSPTATPTPSGWSREKRTSATARGRPARSRAMTARSMFGGWARVAAGRGHHDDPGQAPSIGPKSTTSAKCCARTASRSAASRSRERRSNPSRGRAAPVRPTIAATSPRATASVRRLRRIWRLGRLVELPRILRCPPSPGRPPAIRFIVLGGARFQGDHTGLKRAMRGP